MPDAAHDAEAFQLALSTDGEVDARKIYAEAIAWGQREWSSAAPSSDAHAVPAQIMPIVETLLG
jgi:hypothetical protein